VEKTYYPKANELTHYWYLVDANGQTLGRLASQIANIIRGKHKPDFTPGVDGGDFVVVINCERVVVTGNKLEDKMYYRHSGYPGGLTEIKLRDLLARYPERVIQKAVKVYSGPEHPHSAQNPKPISFD
jgi:large subunit ribosomal protein L13